MQKINPNDPQSQSANIVDQNLEQLKQLFPEVFKEGKIDWEELQATLGEHIETENERFNFSWNGKSMARREAQKPSTGTLRPCPEESVDWDNTQNLYIEGDNLEVLKLLQKSYHQKVKMIYIDPPYNTGKDFVYKDNYKDNLSNYLKLTGQTDEEGKKLSTNSDASGRYHSNWLNMMYPRLKLARNLLKDDGVIFISIDDNEVDNLRKVCNEIFGEENFIGQIMPIANPGGRDYNQVAITHEYLLIYQKSDICDLKEIEKEVNFKFKDSNGGFEYRELRNRNPKFHSGNRPNLFYPFFVNPSSIDKNGYCNVSLEKSGEFMVEVKPYNSKGQESVWRWGKPKAKSNIVKNNSDLSQILAKQKKDGNWNIYEKNRRSTTKVKSIWSETEMRTENGTRLVRELFGKTIFDHPKPIGLIERICEISGNTGITLDFFSGSSSSAHAVLKQNINDKGDRRFIMVQLPEVTPEESEARKDGYNTIPAVAKERIRRAGKKIAEENPEKAKDLDLGFKVFKLDSSNIHSWDPETKDLESYLTGMINNLKEDRSEQDILFEILLKYGLDLTIPITEHQIENVTVYNVGGGALLVCLADDITIEVAEDIAKLKEEQNPEFCRVVFKDTGFANSVIKTNVLQKMKQYGIEEVRSI